MCIFPKRFTGRLIPLPPKYYVKDGKIYYTKNNKLVDNSKQ
jgi:hypothetical protein